MNMFKKFFTIVIITLMLVLTGCDAGQVTNYGTEIETKEIKSIYLRQENETSASGVAFIMFGNYSKNQKINTKYYLYIKGEYGYKLQEIDADKLEIVETDEIEPCIKGDFWYGDIDERYTYIAYIPTNSIIEEYDVNLVE